MIKYAPSRAAEDRETLMLLERWQQIPTGTRDLLPAEAARVREVVGGILARMGRWGYREITTPTLEYLDVLVRGEGGAAGDRLFKLVDRDGALLALRPEMTVPVARLAATRMAHAPLPLRLSYAGPVFRWREAGSGRLREFPQVGCELIGAGTLEADAEIVALAVEALAATGVGRCSVSLGHVGFLRGLLAGLGLDDAEVAALRALLYQKDFVGLRDLLERRRAAPAYVNALLALPALRGPGALAEAERLAATPEVRGVVRDLAAVARMLDAYGAGDAVTVDLSIIRDFDYYTGIVFEGHTAALGVPLLGGGRYDGLVERFGASRPATGFAIRVERILSAEDNGADAWVPDVVIAWEGESLDAALGCARALRALGLAATVDVQRRPWEDVAREALARGIRRAVLVRGGAAVVREAGGERVMPVAALAEAAAGGRGIA